MNKKILTIGSVFITIVLALTACTNGMDTANESSGMNADGSTTFVSGTSASAIRMISDINTGTSESENGIEMGDVYEENRFERPFTASDMVYRPDIDILEAVIASNEVHYFVNIQLNGEHPDGGLPGIYGVEIDTDLDGRGELLVLAQSPTQDDWSSNGVQVYRDNNGDVGGSTPLQPDENYTGDGYEKTIFSSSIDIDSEIAAAGWTQDDQPIVSIGFSKALVESEEFSWGVWAGSDSLQPENFDLNDTFAMADAGSPDPDSEYYPLSALELIDNTCRNTSGFSPQNSITGVCEDAYDSETTIAQSDGFYTGGLIGGDDGGTGDNGGNGGDGGNGDNGDGENGDGTGNLLVVTYEDLNGDGTQDPDEPLALNDDFNVSVRANTCDGPLISESALAEINLAGLEPGDYCVGVDTGLDLVAPSQQIIEVPENGTAIVDLGLDLLGEENPNLDPDPDEDTDPDIELDLDETSTDEDSGLDLLP